MPPRNKQPEKRNSRRNIFFSLIAVLLLGIVSIFMATNFISVQSYPPKTLLEFQKDIAEAVSSGSNGLPKFKSIVYNASTGSFLVERLFSFNGKPTNEFYSVLGLIGVLRPNPLENTIDANSPLTYLQAILSRNSPALATNAIISLKTESRSWGRTLLDLIPTLTMIAMTVGLYYFFFRGIFKGVGGMGGSSPFGRTPAHRINSNIRFTDIAGCEEVKEEVKELVDYLKNPKRYSQVGARIPKGILLGGPPGTGKTLVAKAVAGEANVPFYFISASGFVEVFVGLGAKRVRDIFNQARADSPSIVFIDELDAVGRSRNSSNFSGGDSERENTLNQLLVEMDGMIENSGVLVMAATNRNDVLDEALLRPGRFDRIISMSLPDLREREAILALHAKGKRFSNNITFKNIAKRTPGFSGAQLENVINEASLLSVRERSQVITLPMIDEAIDRVMSGPARRSRASVREAVVRVSYHEAGHAVVALKLDSSYKVQKITIIPRGDAGGYNLLAPEHEDLLHSKRDLLARIASFMGGRAAEEIIFGAERITTGSSDDIEKATGYARRMVTRWGMSKLGPVNLDDDRNNLVPNRSQLTQDQIDSEIREILNRELERARETIRENLNLLELIKDTLLEKETIVLEEIEYLAKNLKPLPEEGLGSEKEQPSTDLGGLLDEVSSKFEV